MTDMNYPPHSPRFWGVFTRMRCFTRLNLASGCACARWNSRQSHWRYICECDCMSAMLESDTWLMSMRLLFLLSDECRSSAAAHQSIPCSSKCTCTRPYRTRVLTASGSLGDAPATGNALLSEYRAQVSTCDVLWRVLVTSTFTASRCRVISLCSSSW